MESDSELYKEIDKYQREMDRGYDEIGRMRDIMAESLMNQIGDDIKSELSRKDRIRGTWLYRFFSRLAFVLNGKNN